MTRLDTKTDLERKYAAQDPWGFRTHADDHERKRRILEACKKPYRNHETGGYIKVGTYVRALDIGAGEGWITKDLPAKEKYAYEISDRAASRLPEGVTRWNMESVPFHPFRFDLVTVCGVFYKHYEWQRLHLLTKHVAEVIVVTCHLEDSEIPLEGHQVYEERFPYRGRTQRLAVYDFSG